MPGDEGHHACFGRYDPRPESRDGTGSSVCDCWCKQADACQKATRQPPAGGGRRA